MVKISKKLAKSNKKTQILVNFRKKCRQTQIKLNLSTL